MPTYDATEAHKYVKQDQMESFKQAMANADREGKEVYEVFIANGVPVMYSIRDKTT